MSAQHGLARFQLVPKGNGLDSQFGRDARDVIKVAIVGERLVTISA